MKSLKYKSDILDIQYSRFYIPYERWFSSGRSNEIIYINNHPRLQAGSGTLHPFNRKIVKDLHKLR